MKNTTTFYQNECAKQIFQLIKNGEKRITLLMPTGTGKLFICLLIADMLAADDFKTVIISDKRAMAHEVMEVIWDRCENKIESTTLDRFLIEKTSENLIILYGLRPSSRMKMQAYANENPDTCILSIGEPIFSNEPMRESTLDYYFNHLTYDPSKENATLGDLALLYKRLGDIKPLIYCSENIVDIRDIISADSDEIKEIYGQIERDSHDTNREIMILSEDPALTGDSEILEIFQKMRRKLQYCEQLLVCCGIPQDTIDEEFDEIECLRKSMEGQFFGEDGSVNDCAISAYQTAVADSVLRVSKRLLTLETYDRYQDLLSDKLTKEVWEKKLCKESQNYLITAKMTFESMRKMAQKENLDYGGVCLLVTKVLDTELARRFYLAYVEYLKTKYPTRLDKWPDAMVAKDRYGRLNVLDDKKFTLGTVSYVAGLSPDGRIKNPYNNKCLLEFAGNELYESKLSTAEVDKRIKNLIKYTDKVRDDYRNPSAHRNAINYVIAEDCMNYMVEVYIKLKEILEDMRW